MVHIGDSLSNQSLSVGDTDLTSSGIVITGSMVIYKLLISHPVVNYCVNCTQSIKFELGQSILNTYDNLIDSGDTIVVNIHGYISNNGVGISRQVRLSLC